MNILKTNKATILTNLALLISIALFIPSCASVYVSPTSGNLAKIDIFDNGSGNNLVKIFENSFACSQAKSAPQRSADGKTTIFFPRGKALSLMFASNEFRNGRIKYCQIIVTFPITKKHYKIVSTNMHDRCGVYAIEKNESETPVNITKRQSVVAMSESGPWCERDQRFLK